MPHTYMCTYIRTFKHTAFNGKCVKESNSVTRLTISATLDLISDARSFAVRMAHELSRCGLHARGPIINRRTNLFKKQTSNFSSTTTFYYSCFQVVCDTTHAQQHHQFNLEM